MPLLWMWHFSLKSLPNWSEHPVTESRLSPDSMTWSLAQSQHLDQISFTHFTKIIIVLIQIYPLGNSLYFCYFFFNLLPFVSKEISLMIYHLMIIIEKLWHKQDVVFQKYASIFSLSGSGEFTSVLRWKESYIKNSLCCQNQSHVILPSS